MTGSPNKDENILPDGTVVCLPVKRGEEPERLKPDETWKALVTRFYRNNLLGQAGEAGAPRLIRYRFTNEYDRTVQERPQEGVTPIRDLSQDPAYQAEVRRAMDELERIAHVRFVPAARPDETDLAIGHADRWNKSMKDEDVGGHASHADGHGFSHMMVIAGKAQQAGIIRHELGHALGLGHPRNYPKQPFATLCDVGSRHDVQNRTVMSYAKIMQHYAEDDVLALQSLYGVSQHPAPYVVPRLAETIALIPQTPAARLESVIDYRDAAQITVKMAGKEVLLPNLSTQVSVVNTSEADDHVTFLNPPQRIRFIYQGGRDVLRVEDTGRIVGIANNARTPAQMRVEASRGNTIIIGANQTESETGELTVRVLGLGAVATDAIKAKAQKVTSGITGHEADGVMYELVSEGKKTSIAVPRGVVLHVEDDKGEQLALPAMPPVSSEQRQR